PRLLGFLLTAKHHENVLISRIASVVGERIPRRPHVESRHLVVAFSLSGQGSGGDPARRPIWKSGLRALVNLVVFPGLGLAIVLTLAKIVAQSGAWDLPSGKLLDTVLSSCQFEHATHSGEDVEHMICPTRLRGSDFPRVLEDAVVASED